MQIENLIRNFKKIINNEHCFITLEGDGVIWRDKDRKNEKRRTEILVVTKLGGKYFPHRTIKGIDDFQKSNS